MPMFAKLSLLRLAMSALALGGVLSACSSPSSGPTTYTYGDAVPAITALSAGMAAAAGGQTPSATETSTNFGTIFSFTGFFHSPYSLTGSLDEVPSVSINGTVNFTGGSVTQIKYNSVTSAPSGTYQITFSGGAVYVYNLATETFTLS